MHPALLKLVCATEHILAHSCKGYRSSGGIIKGCSDCCKKKKKTTSRSILSISSRSPDSNPQPWGRVRVGHK